MVWSTVSGLTTLGRAREWPFSGLQKVFGACEMAEDGAKTGPIPQGSSTLPESLEARPKEASGCPARAAGGLEPLDSFTK